MQETFTVSSSKRFEIIDINDKIKDIVKKSGVKQGICAIYACHATSAIIVNENYDPNICVDLLNCLEKLIPQGKWIHDRIDGNADSHIKASIIGPSEFIPIKDGNLMLGTWQNIMFADFDGPREDRKIIVTIIEDK